MSAIDLDSFNSTPLKKDPYDFLIVPGFIAADYRHPFYLIS